MLPTNADIKLVRSLADKKFRDQLGLFVVEGDKMVAEALASGFEVVKLFKRDEAGEVAMRKMSALSSPPPSLAVLRKRPQLPAQPCSGLSVALDSVRDPGNVGTIIRLSDWFGVSTVFASPDSVEIYNPKVIQASMGSIFRVNVVYTDIPALCDAYASAGMPVWGTFLDGDNVYGADLGGDGLVVMGNESNGVSAATAQRVSSRLLIPRFGRSGAESLNVATATAIILSEFRRR